MFAIARHLKRRQMAAGLRQHRQRLSCASGPLEMPSSNEDYRHLLDEVTVLRRKRAQIGMAVVLGEIDRPLCAELKQAVGKLADYIAYAPWGPYLVVAFQRTVFEQLNPLWQDLLAGVPGICAGVAFPDDEMDTPALVLAAHLALQRALDSQCGLVAFDETEARAETAGFGGHSGAIAPMQYPCNGAALTST